MACYVARMRTRTGFVGCVLLGALSLVAWVGATSPSAVAAGTGTTETGTIGRAAVAYSYRVHVPASYDGHTRVPLVVFAHGCQTTAEQQQNASLYDAVADREGFIVLYPDVNPIEANQPGPLNRCWQFPLPTSSREAFEQAMAEEITTQRVAAE